MLEGAQRQFKRGKNKKLYQVQMFFGTVINVIEHCLHHIIFLCSASQENSTDIFLSFLSFYTATPPREDYVQVECVLKPRCKKCMEKGMNKR